MIRIPRSIRARNYEGLRERLELLIGFAALMLFGSIVLMNHCLTNDECLNKVMQYSNIPGYSE
jgi:hypothetical protein